jgi:REP element-mobilizing transposase RayT
MSLTKLWIHCVWSTKQRYPFLKKDLRSLLFDHIIKNADSKSIEIIQIGGWEDHVHILIKIHPSQNLSSVIHLIKGESSSWINKEKYFFGSFAWQDSYYAESIGKKDIKVVKNYIKNQEEHHSKISYLEEINSFQKAQ